MTVAELITELEQKDKNLKVWIDVKGQPIKELKCVDSDDLENVFLMTYEFEV